MATKTGNDLFIVDNSDEDWKVLNYLAEWSEISHKFDIATGYFEIGSLLALDGKWQKLDQIRILMGDEVTKRTHRALAEGLARVGQLLDDSIEREKQKNDFLTGVDQIVQAITSGKIQCRVYAKKKFHAKAYITHSKLAVVGSSALVGSSNFTYPGLTGNVELNVQLRREVEELQQWFDAHWADAEDASAEILKIMERQTRNYLPFEVYAKARLEPEYRYVLVDEVQDLGTLELSIIRKLTITGKNDLFLSGDAAQTIYTKSSDLKAANIDVAGRSVSLKQNYRNSRQILTSAHAALVRSLEEIPKCALHLEVLPPEFASFSSPKPLLLKAESIQEELNFAINYLNDLVATNGTNQRFCLVICGYSQAAVEELGTNLAMPVLSATTDIRAGRIFMSDLEQTKGFEFDAVVVVNCTSAVMPHPILPAEESFRDLSRLYVAMTRAKSQLLVSYHGAPSRFIEVARDTFTEGHFSEHAELGDGLNIKLPAPAVPVLGDPDVWASTARSFLKSRDAVGMSRLIQDAILANVTGKDLMRGPRHKQAEWKTFDSFISSMQSPRARHQVISAEAWEALNKHLRG